MTIPFPKIYPILDASFLPATGRSAHLHKLACSLAEAGVTLLQYRNQTGTKNEILADLRVLRGACPSGGVKLILDDRADLVERAGFDGVHLEDGDMTPAQARELLGPVGIIGTFGGGGDGMVPGILETEANYFSIGIVYPTRTKQVSTPPIGIEGVRRLRAEAGPDAVLVAVGGITLENAAEVLEAGASAEFHRWMTTLGFDVQAGVHF
jgi:thiamine-phosphate pyrophosphorylase